MKNTFMNIYTYGAAIGCAVGYPFGKNGLTKTYTKNNVIESYQDRTMDYLLYSHIKK